jgi:DNA-directed RNA polymerase specialized sigma24 family protein
VRDDLFLAVYPLARRAAAVRSAAAKGAMKASWLDREDIEQEILMSAWLSLGRFDPLRASLPTFIERVIGTKTTSIVRRERAQKRIRPEVNGPGIGTVHITVTIELRVDIRRALQRLNRADQIVAQLLLEHNPTDIARKLRCSRAAVYRSIENIRAVFRRLGLEKY